MASLALGSTAAHATLAPGTPLKTLMAANGGRYFGSDMTGDLLSNSTVTQLQAQQFSMLTPGNEMKWDTTEPSNGTFNFTPGQNIVNYAKANNERVRCHNLVWHSQLPGWVSSLPTNQVQAAMENHITTEANAFKGKCYAWDVVNEPFNEDGSLRADAFFNAMGSGYIADALRTAHAADPNAKLYLNDFNIEGMNAKSNAMFSLAQSLLAQGVPLNGIGFESHFILGQIPSDMEANMQRFANLGLDVAVTELDVRVTQLPATSANLTQQATDFSNVVKDCLGVTRCVGVTQWAVGDADSWVPGAFSGQGAATMFDQNYNPKPAFTAVQQALGGGSSQNTVTVTNPGTQSGTVGTAASLQIHATDSASGQTLSYAASGLPTGLSINASSGLISGTPTASAAASNAVNVTVTDTTGAVGTVSFTWNISGGSSGGGTCHVTYTKNSEWPGGFTAQVNISNTGTTTISGWSLTFTFPGDQKITSNFNGGFSQTGENATLTNASYNGSIAPGSSVTDGFQGSWTTSDAAPTSFTLNGATCTT